MEISRLDLPFSEYQFLFQATEEINFPEYTGSMWRGSFGHSLKALACCGVESHSPDCIYSQLFESGQQRFVQNELTRNSTTLPVPYVFRAQRQLAKKVSFGEWFSIDLLLVAKANQHLNLIIKTMERLANIGIGKGQGRAKLIEVTQKNNFGNTSVIYADAMLFTPDYLTRVPVVSSHSSARIHIETPMNLGNNQKEFYTHKFLMSVVRRISLLQRIYADSEPDVDFSWLKQQSLLIESKANVWIDGWRKHSTRQQSYQPVRGWMGDIFLQGEALQHFWPYLYLGQWVHCGKMTNIGLGRYQLQRVVVS